MTATTSIEWTEVTWNPVRGCSRISPGCERCYAERLAHRFSGPGQPYEALTRTSRTGPRWTGRLRLVDDAIDAPLRWRRPRVVFVNSMSDLFHPDVPTSFIERVFETMERARWHTFQILTKRADRLAELALALPWPANVWMGVSVESERYLDRVERLRSVPATVRFLSLEPLLGPLPTLDLAQIDWVIVGGESGPRARPMAAEWVREIRRKCDEAAVALFFKQWGGTNKRLPGRELDGRTHDAMPPAARAVSLPVVGTAC